MPSRIAEVAEADAVTLDDLRAAAHGGVARGVADAAPLDLAAHGVAWPARLLGGTRTALADVGRRLPTGRRRPGR
jgi:hypothetical protein